jgi:site-specific recombinase XerD
LFFADRLARQRDASPNTIAGYRDTFRLLLAFVGERLKKTPSQIELEDLEPRFIGAFLDDLERTRGNSARTRNVRLSAIRSFFRYVSLEEPACSGIAQRVLSIPNKRHASRPVEFLTSDEIAALVSAPDLSLWSGRRDRALLVVALQTGLRASELIGLRRQDVILDRGPRVWCTGKGRKERETPLRREVAAVLRAWIEENHQPDDSPLFPNARGTFLSRDGLEYILRKHIATARMPCSSLRKKRVSAHVLRHSAAMDLLQNGVDRSVIALWLGHESIETTQIYLHADLRLKENALAKTTPLRGRRARFRPDDDLLAFLKSL